MQSPFRKTSSFWKIVGWTVVFALLMFGVAAVLATRGCTVSSLAAAQPTAQQIAAPVPTAAPGQLGSYSSKTMDVFDYTWSYMPGTDQKTPKIRDDSDSTGKTSTKVYDIGIHPGEFGIVKGFSVNFNGTTYGDGKLGCALFMLTPGYYRNITVTDGRFEVYFLPNSNPLDPTGWSKVLADQAQSVEHSIYKCPNKALSEIPVFFSSELAPFGQ